MSPELAAEALRLAAFEWLKEEAERKRLKRMRDDEEILLLQ